MQRFSFLVASFCCGALVRRDSGLSGWFTASVDSGDVIAPILRLRPDAGLRALIDGFSGNS